MKISLECGWCTVANTARTGLVCPVVFPIKVLINYQTKEFGFISRCPTSFRKITSFWGVIIFLRNNNNFRFIYVKGKFIWSKPQCYFGQFCVKDFYCTVNRIILNIYRCVLSKKYKRQYITRVHNIIDVDKKE